MNKWFKIGVFVILTCFLTVISKDLKAQDTLSAFVLKSPSDSLTWGVSQLCNASRTFTWQRSYPSVPALVGYKVHFYGLNQPTAPIWTWPAQGMLTDTFATIPEDSLNVMIALLGVPIRQQSNVYWKVMAENDSTKLSRFSESDFFLGLSPVQDSLGNAVLISPIDSSSLNITRITPINLTFSWNSAFYNVVNPPAPTTYQLQFDTSSNFNNPLWFGTTTDTFLTLSRGRLDSLALSGGLLSLNQLGRFFWRVEASQCAVSGLASSVKMISFTRIDETIQPFSVLTPSFGQAIEIRENTPTSIDFRWNSASVPTSSLPIQSTLLIDSLNGNFSQPWLSISVAQGDTQIAINTAQIRQRLINSSIGFNQSSAYKWAVRASNGITQLLSGNANLIFFERKQDSISTYASLIPSDSLSLRIPQTGQLSQTFIWQPAAHSIGDTMRYRWKFWPISGNPQSPKLQLEAGNSGLQNSLIIDRATWNTMLDTAGVALNQVVEGYWAVEARAGGLNRLSDSIRYIRLERVIDSLSSFGFVAPASGSIIRVAQLANQSFRIFWSKSRSLLQYPVNYTIRIDTPGVVGSAPLFITQITNDTLLALSSAQLNALLQNIGVGIGASRMLRFSIDATAGGQFIVANGAWDIVFQRIQDSIGTFSPITPSVASTRLVGNTLPSVTFRWSKPASFPDSLRYELLFDVLSGNFSGPIFSRSSGSDTVLSITGGFLDSLLSNLNVSQGQSYNLKWAVRSSVGSLNRLSSSNTLTLRRFADSLSNFSLLNPLDSALVIVSGFPSTTFQLKWESSRSTASSPVTYFCYFDVLGGNFSNPFFSKSAGTDTAVSISYLEMANALSTIGVNPGDTGNYVWTVKAESGNLSLQAKRSNFLRLGWNFFTSTLIEPAQFQVYPNPVQDQLFIHSNFQSSWTYQVLDVEGRVRASGVLTTPEHLSSIDVHTLNAGLYLLRIQMGSSSTTLRFVKE